MSRDEEVWHVALVDDDKGDLQKTKDHLEKLVYADRRVRVHEFEKLADSALLLRQFKLHLVIMDVYEDTQPRGIAEVSEWTKKGCAPVILHTFDHDGARAVLKYQGSLRSDPSRDPAI